LLGVLDGVTVRLGVFEGVLEDVMLRLAVTVVLAVLEEVAVCDGVILPLGVFERVPVCEDVTVLLEVLDGVTVRLGVLEGVMDDVMLRLAVRVVLGVRDRVAV
jgi:hypothetical protein